MAPSTVCRVTETPSTRTARPVGADTGPPVGTFASAAGGAGSGDVVEAAAEPVADTGPRRLALSPSRAADFKQCPLLYRFRAIDRLPEVPGPAQVRGTLVHAVLDRLYALPAAERVPAAAHALVEPVWEQLRAADPRLSVPEPTAPAGIDVARPAGIEPLLDAYFAVEDPRGLEPEARELLVEAELESGLLLRGYVDRIDRTDGTDGADPAAPDASTAADSAGDSPAAPGNGGYRVVDYKTGSAPGPLSEARALFQMKFYALVLLLLRGHPPGELRLMYLTGPEVLRYEPDEAQLRRFGRMLDAMWVAIRAAGATGDFRPNPGPGCAWCCHRAVCPAWDGVPPPYPGWPAEPDQPAAP